MSDTRGRLLLASPVMEESFFARAVIAMVEDNDEGSFGLILNQPTPLMLKQAWANISEDACPRDTSPIYRGGPVQGPLVALHSQAAHAEQTLSEGVYFCAAQEHVEAIATDSTPALFFVGYSGWGAGQLAEELQATSWVVGPPIGPWLLDHNQEHEADTDPEQAGDELWRVCMQMTDPTLGYLARHPQIVPGDPNMN